MTKKGQLENDKKIARTLVGNNIICYNSEGPTRVIPLNKR